MKLILFNGMLNQLQNWIMREPILLRVLIVPTLNLYTMMTQFMRVGLSLDSLLCIRAFW